MNDRSADGFDKRSPLGSITMLFNSACDNACKGRHLFPVEAVPDYGVRIVIETWHGIPELVKLVLTEGFGSTHHAEVLKGLTSPTAVEL
jgi:hypothetical protein